LSLILCAIMLCTVILPIKSVEETEKTTLYSGGSGTEDDPYLISTAADIEAIYNYTLTPESCDLTAPRVYYKLTNDIVLNRYKTNISPLYINNYIGPNALKSATDYPLESSAKENAQNLLDEAIAKYGKLYVRYCDEREYYYGRQMLREKYTHKAELIEVSEASLVYGFHIANIESRSPGYETIIFDPYSGLFYNVGFTGILDGNGYTIKLTKSDKNMGYLFGYLKSGAVVKNLNLKGTDSVSFAYEAEEGSLIENCSIYTERGFVEGDYCKEFQRESYCYDYGEALLLEYEVVCSKHEEFGNSAIVNSYGTVKGCYNLSSKAGCFYGDEKIDLKDVNQARRVLLGVAKEPDMIYSDMNMDGRFDAKDIQILQQIVAGLNLHF